MESHKIPWFQTTNQLWLDIGSNEFPVGGFNPSEKILVSWDDYSKYMENI